MILKVILKMALIKKDNSASAKTPVQTFEDAPEDTVEQAAPAQVTNETTKAAMSEARSLAVPKPTAVVATRSTKLGNVLEELKD